MRAGREGILHPHEFGTYPVKKDSQEDGGETHLEKKGFFGRHWKKFLVGGLGTGLVGGFITYQALNNNSSRNTAKEVQGALNDPKAQTEVYPEKNKKAGASVYELYSHFATNEFKLEDYVTTLNTVAKNPVNPERIAGSIILENKIELEWLASQFGRKSVEDLKRDYGMERIEILALQGYYGFLEKYYLYKGNDGKLHFLRARPQFSDTPDR